MESKLDYTFHFVVEINQSTIKVDIGKRGLRVNIKSTLGLEHQQ